MTLAKNIERQNTLLYDINKFNRRTKLIYKVHLSKIS